MADLPSGPSPEEQAKLSICIFPHLAEFLVIDASGEDSEAPRLHCLTTGEVLDESFYQEVETDFRELLRRPDQPLPYLMTLPQQLEATLRLKALKAILRTLNDATAAKLPDQVAILFCAGDILATPTSQIEQVLQGLTGERADSQLVSQWASQFEELRERERREVERETVKRRHEAVQPSDGEFLTLWEKPR